MVEKISAEEKGIRIAKYIAHAGYCSRRDAEVLIAEGRVKVNGQVIETPATLITDHSVKIDDKLINANKEIRLWLFHKPKGIITSNKDEKKRKTIFDFMPKTMPRTVTIGRLDFNTEGLLLLTTNGDFARYLELPKTKLQRKYRARVFGKVNHERLKKLERGITVEGTRYGSIKVEVDNEGDSNSWLTIIIEEGKKREIRKVMEHLGLQVNRLIRISFGPFELGALKVGELQEVSRLSLKKHFGENFKF
ncbi:MAG: rRNA pseudouridine synthase [Proteobacteria bacterium]|nr:rRNA pseudouridine synthase [Pseudomonadota bacterium]